MSAANHPKEGAAAASRRKRPVPGVSREDSDDELGNEDLPWEWIYSDKEAQGGDEPGGDRKRRKVSNDKIIGARLGSLSVGLETL